MRSAAHSGRRLLLIFGSAFVFVATASAQAMDPSTCLRDTGKPDALGKLLATLPADWSPPVEWSSVPEDKLDHAFKGHAVFHNDKLMVVLGKAMGAGLYSRGPSGWVLRPLIVPMAGEEFVGDLSGMRIVENNPGAVAIEATYKVKSARTATVEFRLTAGVSFVQVKPGAGT